MHKTPSKDGRDSIALEAATPFEGLEKAVEEGDGGTGQEVWVDLVATDRWVPVVAIISLLSITMTVGWRSSWGRW